MLKNPQKLSKFCMLLGGTELEEIRICSQILQKAAEMDRTGDRTGNGRIGNSAYGP